MPTMVFCPVQAAAPVANKDQSEEKPASHEVAVSLASSVPEMYRRTLTAMIDGQKISPLLPLPHIDCCLKAAIDTSSELPKGEDQEETSEDELVKKTDGKAEKVPEDTENDASAAWVFKPSVGTWLLPLHAQAEDEVETASKVLESSVPAVSEPKAVKVVKAKGLGARIKTWFCCVKASAAEPTKKKSTKKASAAEPKSMKAAKAGKSKP
eukprot:gnl/MRDRNA2_/MRDRNA2_87799_c0_seq1.p1 gnl/MRDRNA2_/MRDRNA2_87799_c0~~gnl/MRDRNA2_/MRDRNA2_87799_c0_seq1.p1  ORF type:complete len:210 (+),score=63.73 gnl/MRDRNA2_/MRDRNA2_87799_c0_seq1:94-723(+)